MNNEQIDVNVKEEELSLVNGGAKENYLFFCTNSRCKNYKVKLYTPGYCNACGKELVPVHDIRPTVIV